MRSVVRRSAAAVALLLLAVGCSPGAASRPAVRGAASPTARDGAAPAPTVLQPPNPALAPYYRQTPHWAACGDGFQCTQVRVPLDYARPAGATIALAVIRLPAADRGRRVGSLLLNPGGPGASGLSYAQRARSLVNPSVRARFDIVGFDPRGVGASAPVRCLSDRETDTYYATDMSPDSSTEQRALETQARLFARRCQQHSAKLLAHVSTADAARDVDVLRAALGDDRLHYLGKSYGTLLGATYAALFPHRVGAVVLDGAIDPRLGVAALNRGQAQGFETALVAFLADCARLASCPLPPGRTVALSRIDALLSEVDARPMSTRDPRPLTQSLAVLGIAASLYDDSNWPVLRTALRAAFAGDGSSLLDLADSYLDRGPDGRYESNISDANAAISCLDRPGVGGVAAVSAEAAALRRISPRFGDVLAWSGLLCAYWPARPEGRAAPLSAAGSAPILVLGTVRDPATPYAWAVGLAHELGSGVLLTYDGDGHTAYGRGSVCVDRAVDSYLLTGRPPATGARCR